MIYFQPVLQKTLFSIFHSALKDGGYLFLGKSESANDVSDVFVPVCGTERIYAHVGEGKMPDTLASSFSVQLPPTPTNNGSALHDVREDGEQVDKLYSTFLERFLPPSVVIDENNQAVHFFGDYSSYLSISPGKASFSIFNLVHEDLSLAASTAISQCRSRFAQPNAYRQGSDNGRRQELHAAYCAVPHDGEQHRGPGSHHYRQHRRALGGEQVRRGRASGENGRFLFLGCRSGTRLPSGTAGAIYLPFLE